MPETFAQYLEKWLKQSTSQGLTNPLIKMPVKRFRLLQQPELDSIDKSGLLFIGTMSDPLARNLYRTSQTRIRERGEHCVFISCGTVEMVLPGAFAQRPRVALFPVFLKRASLSTSGDKIKVTVSDEETWRANPVLEAHLRGFDISLAPTLSDEPQPVVAWVKGQLGNHASRVTYESYVGLFSSQQMVLQERLTEPPLRQALARNPVVRAKIDGGKVGAIDLGEVTDDGLEELGLVLPCDDSQLRVIQLSHEGCCLQVEGPPGTGKSQTIANIISNALYHGRNALLVCDKKAAIVQVEERLTDCGLKPALLNLHDEDLDKRDFLKQATAKFPRADASQRDGPSRYPIEQLCETRKVLNERVKFGRSIAHPSLQVTKRQALAGLIQLRKELLNVPNLSIPQWQSLSKERLGKLLASLAEWPDLTDILSNSGNVWNKVKCAAFDENPNAARELESAAQGILTQLVALEKPKEWVAAVGIELQLESDRTVADILAIVRIVLEKPACYPKVVGNSELTQQELKRLQSEWNKRDELLAARHPVPLAEPFSSEARREAENLLTAEGAESWQNLSGRETDYTRRQAALDNRQEQYRRLCAQVGLVYSPLLTVRRAQLQVLLGLGAFGGLIPRAWWNSSTSPVLLVNGWIGNLKACMSHAKAAPVPLHWTALEHAASTHWVHIEAMAERGFDWLSDCLNYVHNRKCKFALRQAYPGIPIRGFKAWHEITLHAVRAREIVASLRRASEGHFVLTQLTENYLASAHEQVDPTKPRLDTEDVDRFRRLRSAAALVEQWRGRSDMFEVASVHWQTFWESPSANVLAQAQILLSELDAAALTDGGSDNLEDGIRSCEESRQRIQHFLAAYEKQEGDRTQSVLVGFDAQREFARCQEQLGPLRNYTELQEYGQFKPDWEWLHKTIAWRDSFEKACGTQKLDVDSALWARLQTRLTAHQNVMKDSYRVVDGFFEDWRSGIGDYTSMRNLQSTILEELPRHPRWLEKKHWEKRMPAFPELNALWGKITAGNVRPCDAERLFCFNLLRLCDPIAQPQGPELKQTVLSFVQQDDKLTFWMLDHLKARLGKLMQDAAANASQSESELRRLLGLQRVRGTVRELLTAHYDYLLAAKRCWMMSPTSLANLIASDIFEKYDVPFDIVVFDEASQIHVLDGLLSMTFGKQVVIVGDKNQLPPTDFFASFAQSDDETDTQGFGISESLLNEFDAVFEDEKTHVMLMSHYRSETPDLIRFSNDWFYDSKLEMYPPAHVSGIGRRLHYVPNAIYSESAGQRNNPVEAAEVFKLITLHVRECPDKSLGVVAMNIPQMELIDEYIQSQATEAVRTFCADDSKFFIKNLETVQGDEMDRIILSLTYGKNADKHFSAAVLGPLTKSGGERRLNVAITRSRNGMTIVSSLRAADLEAAGAHSRGFSCLKALLADLENMALARTFGINSKRFDRHNDGVSNIIHCESPFEEQVVEFLENEGYEIECQYGAGKFWLDIVVKERGRNLLAIECDGASYHSSLVARTRDRARQRILEKLGWRVHRVWSTNWWFFEQQEKESILSAINAAREAARRRTRA